MRHVVRRHPSWEILELCGCLSAADDGSLFFSCDIRSADTNESSVSGGRLYLPKIRRVRVRARLETRVSRNQSRRSIAGWMLASAPSLFYGWLNRGPREGGKLTRLTTRRHRDRGTEIGIFGLGVFMSCNVFSARPALAPTESTTDGGAAAFSENTAPTRGDDRINK